MVKLLPAPHAVRTAQQRAAFDERALKHYDAAIIAIERDNAGECLQELPHAQLWQRLFEDARRRGPVGLLSARLGPSAALLVVVLVSKKSSTLDLAGCIAVSEGSHLARWLTMLPPNVLDSRGYRRAVTELARRDDSDLDSAIADILQCTSDSKGDHILAARFLNRFVPPAISWVHLDLAASNRSGGLGHIASDFTGFGVRYATHLLLEQELPDFSSPPAPLLPAKAPPKDGARRRSRG